MKTNSSAPVDVVLIGAGIMSATLGVMLKTLQPDLTIRIYERLDQPAAESSDAWNNAGTGHSAFCELNYTPERPDGTVDISKAIKIAEQFETSKEWWAHLTEQGIIDPATFLRRIPHMSFVWGADNVSFLKTRYNSLTQHPLFEGMRYSEDRSQIAEWAPLIMEGREDGEPFAATRMEIGTDVDFGALTRSLLAHLKKQDGVEIFCEHEIRDIDKEADGGYWYISIKDLSKRQRKSIHARFIFIGAGGGALPLLEKTDIPEAAGYGGFPVGGQWLRCTNDEVIEKHCAKVYGKAAVGAPPMSVPHLDTRVIGGKRSLLFGPYAGFSTKFLKHGSLLDLPKSIHWDNIRPMLSAGIHNIPLTKYLIDQVRQSPEDRLEALHEYLPTTRMEDWELAIAGQRVQIIKKDEKGGGTLEFGTEIVASADGTVAALLGASPGASTAVPIMLDLLKRCFSSRSTSPEWQSTLKKIIPSYGVSLANNPEELQKIRHWTSEVLNIQAH